eukprot:9723137-Alexandrium_andersonii.AAC.1
MSGKLVGGTAWPSATMARCSRCARNCMASVHSSRSVSASTISKTWWLGDCTGTTCSKCRAAEATCCIGNSAA